MVSIFLWIASLWLLFSVGGCATAKTSMSEVHFQFAQCPVGSQEKLADSFRQSLQQGLSCFDQMGPLRQKDAADLKKILQTKPTTLACDQSLDNMARSLTPASKDFPGITFNLESFNAETLENQKPTAFHESLHWLGYKHFEGLDVTYLAEICCFDSRDPLACEMLGKDGSTWITPEYHQNFTRLLSPYGRGFIGLATAWHAAFSLRGTSGFPENGDALIAASLQELKPQYTDPTYGKIFAASIEQNFSVIEKDKDKTAFYRGLGHSLRGLLLQKPETLAAAWKEVQAHKNKACAKLSPQEKIAVHRSMGTVGWALFQNKDAPPREIYENWSKPCP